MTTLPTRQQIEEAPAITFDKPRKRQRGVTIQLTYHGALVSFAFSADDNVPIVELEQSIDTLLKREGWAAMPQPSANAVGGNGKAKATWVDPEYDDNGDPICPVHRKSLKQGQYGSYCSAKAKDGQVANDKGYCALKFKE